MAIDYAQKFCQGNRVGLHYSHFGKFWENLRLKINCLRREEIFSNVESAKSG